ncbi:aspartate/glutamate racemase family protein [Streptomyces sp. NBC_00328]|uniref:aspartate/glutamate racemase family protein n=1 Tax=Streptomyces sp. NBC_00328 TaxID=2903646 RepID=UPI002E2DD9C8|nr:aspartate/glutamate racemase family protein [Streptomyces sp. NBC_00328]
MKVIGLLGGMSWESTDYYYQQLNRGVRERLGGLHSAKILLHSVDFAEIEALQENGAWEEAGKYLGQRARQLELGGADCVLICTNTMHRVYPDVQDSVGIPVLHIADGTADALERAGIEKVALLGTRYTMEQAFYRDRLTARGLEVLVPEPEERARVHKIIYHELCLGQVLDSSRDTYLRIVESLAVRGAEAVILGCTEIGLLIDEHTSPLPVFDTTLIHVQSALDWALRA